MDTNQTNIQETTENGQEVKVASSAADFRAHFQKAKEGYIIQLPACGKSVRVGTPDMINLVLDGTLPQELISVALKMKGLAEKTDISQLGETELRKMKTFIDNFFCASVLEPRFTTDIENNPELLDVSMIDISDKLVVIELINRGVDALAQFRPK